MGLTVPESIMVRGYRDYNRSMLLEDFFASSTKLRTVLASLTTINTPFPREAR